MQKRLKWKLLYRKFLISYILLQWHMVQIKENFFCTKYNVSNISQVYVNYIGIFCVIKLRSILSLYINIMHSQYLFNFFRNMMIEWIIWMKLWCDYQPSCLPTLQVIQDPAYPLQVIQDPAYPPGNQGWYLLSR